MKRFAAVFLVLLLPAWAWGQLPTEVKVQPGRLAAVEFDIAGKGFAYEVLGDLDAFREFTSDMNKVRLRLIGYTQGEYWLILATVDKGAAAPVINKCKIVVGTPTPGPGPDPGPGPNPPTPVAGLRVLIVEEAMERTKLPAAQVMVILGQPMRDYLNKVCMADPAASSGKSWGIWDKDSDASGMPQPWQTMLGKGKTLTMPAIVIAGPDGTPVYTGPLPADVAATQALINRYVPASTPAKRKAA